MTDSKNLTRNTTTKPELIKGILANFPTISACLTFCSAIFAMAFLYGYTSVFDPSLVMIFEYTDVLKSMLILIPFLFFLFFLIFNIRLNNQPKIYIYLPLIGFLLGSIAKIIIAIYLKKSIYSAINELLLSVTVYLSIYIILKFHESKQFISMRFIYELTFTIGVSFYLIGIIIGGKVHKYGTAHTFLVQIGRNNFRTIKNAKLILFTSHHVVIQSGMTILTIQTNDVKEINSENQ